MHPCLPGPSNSTLATPLVEVDGVDVESDINWGENQIN